MDLKTQYRETLIKLIELNVDHYWLQCFYDMRNGNLLPGGGAGSLNDWGPSYSNKFENIWFNLLYNIVRYLDDFQYIPFEIKKYADIKYRNNLAILRCKTCNQKYIHPDIFERYVALNFYSENIINLTEKGNLLEILRPINSYFSKDAINFRTKLKEEFIKNKINIYNFIENKYLCSGCGNESIYTESDLFIIIQNKSSLSIGLKKQNAQWSDFEIVYNV